MKVQNVQGLLCRRHLVSFGSASAGSTIVTLLVVEVLQLGQNHVVSGCFLSDTQS